MKRQFVGGILTNSVGEVLLVKRAKGDSQMGGLWSLPAGGVEEGETLTQALRREFKEETGIDIVVTTHLTTVNRFSWCVDIFLVTTHDYVLKENIDADIADLQFFPLNSLPEHLVLEAMLPLVQFASLTDKEMTPQAYTNYVEGVFSSLFYSYLAPNLTVFDNTRVFEPIRHAILTTPYRKFKSALLYLMSNCADEAKIYALIPEVTFAIWTVLDDISDVRKYRYNNPTALLKFSPAENANFLFLVLKSLEAFLCREFSDEYSTLVVNSLVTCGEAQIERRANANLTSLEHYLIQSAQRSLFLRRTWTEALRLLGKEAEAVILEEVHSMTSKAGQIINDLMDLRGDLEDFDLGIISYYSILLKNAVDNTPIDLSTFKQAWLKQSADYHVAYKNLLDKHDIDKKMQVDVLELCKNASDHINASALDSDKKQVFNRLDCYEF